MSLFKDMLQSDESIFRDTVVLDYDFVPKVLPHRDGEQNHIASCIRPLFSDRNGRNALITGTPGIGKTVACKHVLKELEQQTDEIHPVFVSCWKKRSSYKIMVDICEQIGYKLTHNKRTDELFREVKRIINKSSAVFVFDEIDRADEFDFLYMLLEEIYKKSVILITNYKDWYMTLDERIRSRLTPETIIFEAYSLEETREILSKRIIYAFHDGVISNDVLNRISEKAYEMKDIRTGLFLLREAGNCAEDKAKKKVEMEDVEKAISKMSGFKKKSTDDLQDDAKQILETVKENSGGKIGEIYREYKKKDDEIIYKTFQRKIKKLADDGYIETKTIKGGEEGSTTIVNYDTTKRLTDYG
ncbi:MAG: Cdc6/Cdc18 family protein [Nanobdellota archaeon]